MEPEKIPNYQSNPEKRKNKAGGITHPDFQTIVQSYSNQNSMLLAQKQIHRPMEQNRELRNKPTHLRPINPEQRRQEYTMKKRQFLQQKTVSLRKLDSYT